MANVGKNIKMFRTRKQMTQEAFAEKLFVSRQTVSNYENNKSNPDVDMLVKIAEVLETDVNTLIYGETEQIHKKKQIRKVVLLVIAAILFGIVVFEGQEYMQFVMERYSEIFLPLTYNITVMVLFYMVVGWVCMEIFFCIFKVQPIKRVYCKWIRYTVIGLLILYVIIILPYLVWQMQYWFAYFQKGHSYANQNHGTMSYDFLWGRFSIGLMLAIHEGWSAIFVIMGMLLKISHYAK